MLEVRSIEFMSDGTYVVNGELVGGNLLENTGLLDKNGKEIYEGDIVWYGSTLGSMTWCEKQAKWCLKMRNGGCMHFNEYFMADKDYEVIGNIHENPELLKSA